MARTQRTTSETVTTPLERAVRWAQEAEASKFSEHALLAQAWATIVVADALQGANYLANGGVNLPGMEVTINGKRSPL